MNDIPSSPMPRPAGPRGLKKLWRGVLRSRAWWLAAILLLAVLVRAPGLTRSVWEDEVSSYLESRRGFGFSAEDLKAMIIVSAPTAYWTSHQLFRVCDALIHTGSDAVTRLPMLLLGLGGIWLGWRLGRLWRDWLLGFILALLLAVWPFKADWDTQVRYYAVMMFLALLQWLACEAWRLRPQSGARFAAAAVITLLGSLSHILAPVLLAVPWIYLAWIAGGRLWREMRSAGNRSQETGVGRQESGDKRPAAVRTTNNTQQTTHHKPQTPRRRWGKLALELAVQAALLAAVSLTVVQYNRGADWLVARTQALAGPRPQIRLLERPGMSRADLPEAAPRSTEQVPGPGACAAYVLNGFKASLTPGAWSPAPLLGLAPTSAMFVELVRGSSPLAANPPENWARWILAGMLAGTLALLLVSPPLAISLWTLILATGLLLQANQASHVLAPRYFTLAGLAGVVLVAAGLAGAINLARRMLARLRPGWSAGAALAAAAACFLWFALAAGPVARRGAAVTIQDWKALLRAVPEKHPGGILYVGVGAKCINYYRELAAAGGGGRDYWTSPLRSRALEKFDAPWLRDMALLDHLNAYDAVACFRYDHWRNEVVLFKEQAALAPPFSAAPPVKGVVAATADLGNRVYVTRGQASLLARPRLLDRQNHKEEAGRRWRLDCIFEVPGVYELTVITPGDVRMTTVTDNMNLPVRLAPRPLGADEVAAVANPAESGKTLPYGLSEEWRAGSGERLPEPGAGARAWVGQLTTPPDPNQPMPLTLRLDAAPGADAPVVRFRLLEPEWVRATASYEIGAARRWEDRENFYFAAPLRLQTAAARNLHPRLYLEEQGTNKDFGNRDCPIEMERGWAAGDVLLLGPLAVPKAQARTLAGRKFMLGMQPLLRVNRNAREQFERDPFVDQRHVNRVLQHYSLGYVRFIEASGMQQLQFLLPQD